MKKCIMTAFAYLVFVLPASSLGSECKTIKSGEIVDANSNQLQVGFDMWGYNYQAHMFNGLYENYLRPSEPVSESLDNLVMKWSDDWLSNQDCNSDGKLDRGLDSKTGISNGTSMGWCTNHIEGDYLGDDNEYHHYTYFVKIVYVGPALTPDPWVGKRIWGQYAIIEEVYNDPYGGLNGVNKDYLVNPAGLGLYTN